MPSATDTPDPAAGGELSHVGGAEGDRQARMVDVGGKPVTRRGAIARALLRFPEGLLGRVLAGSGPKGPVQEVARVAGIQAAKRTPEWIPMCHGLALDHVEITFERREPDLLEVRCAVACSGTTGVEMEALVGASAAALTVYDMSKALSKEISIQRVELLEKRGGKSGDWRRRES